MSIHKECGADIKWARRGDEENRWMPPLEYAGTAIIVTEDGVGVEVTVYKHHQCDPEKVAAWQLYQQKLALLGVDRAITDNLYVVARMKEAEEARTEAEKRKCPRCGARKNQPCTSIAKGPKFGTPTRWPHPERMPAE